VVTQCTRAEQQQFFLTAANTQLRRLLDIVYGTEEPSYIDAALDSFFANGQYEDRLDYEEFRTGMVQGFATKPQPAAVKLLATWFGTICMHLCDEPDPGKHSLFRNYSQMYRGLYCKHAALIVYSDLLTAGHKVSTARSTQ
jgi:hypothetical protein